MQLKITLQALKQTSVKLLVCLRSVGGRQTRRKKSVLIKIPGKGGKQPAALQRDEMLKGGADLTR